MSRPVRSDRHARIELDALLGHILRLRNASSRDRHDTDLDYRWAVHRVWIAIGNEALAYAQAAGLDHRRVRRWARLYEQRNLLTPQRLPDIDEDNLWRAAALRAEEYRATIRAVSN